MNDEIFINAFDSIDEILSIDIDAKSNSVRRVLTSDKVEDWEKAEKCYEQIRQDFDDVEIIAANLSKSPRIVNRVKDHIFIREHQIVIDDVTEFRRLDADPEIVNCWSRLCMGDYVGEDLKLFLHEQVESIIEIRLKVSQTVAHLKTIQLGYDWNPDEAYHGNSSDSQTG
ncbi:Uncharacterised protein [Serratia fonticola]|uniref:hypothetical protein n=1 Tax=Serratia fonticola TaxID=47917 RepID=UPI002178A5CC|nr:hypothetical protein [Serratia fonticola]CAI1819852.1 Uncharacterised protein [Serratia fonticola]